MIDATIGDAKTTGFRPPHPGGDAAVAQIQCLPAHCPHVLCPTFRVFFHCPFWNFFKFLKMNFKESEPRL